MINSRCRSCYSQGKEFCQRTLDRKFVTLTFYLEKWIRTKFCDKEGSGCLYYEFLTCHTGCKVSEIVLVILVCMSSLTLFACYDNMHLFTERFNLRLKDYVFISRPFIYFIKFETGNTFYELVTDRDFYIRYTNQRFLYATPIFFPKCLVYLTRFTGWLLLLALNVFTNLY